MILLGHILEARECAARMARSSQPQDTAAQLAYPA